MSKNLLQVRLNDELETKKQVLIDLNINVSDRVRTFLSDLFDEVHQNPKSFYDNLA